MSIVEKLAKGEYTDDVYAPYIDDETEPKENLINWLYQDVLPLCNEDNDDNDDHTGLWQWLDGRKYSGNETIESLAAEYDKMRRGG